MMTNARPFRVLKPEGLDPTEGGLQRRRSAETRLLILSTAIECIAEYGYARTSSQMISDRAMISRGALQSQYSSKSELMSAVIDYAFYKHLSILNEYISSANFRGEDQISDLIDMEWKAHKSREYLVYMQLALSSQTDEDLAELFLPRSRLHDAVWRDEVAQAVPALMGRPDRLERMRRLIQSVLGGLLLYRDIWNDPEIEAVQLKHLADQVRALV